MPRIVLTMLQDERLGSWTRRRGQPDVVLRNVRVLLALHPGDVLRGEESVSSCLITHLARSAGHSEGTRFTWW